MSPSTHFRTWYCNATRQQQLKIGSLHLITNLTYATTSNYQLLNKDTTTCQSQILLPCIQQSSIKENKFHKVVRNLKLLLFGRKLPSMETMFHSSTFLLPSIPSGATPNLTYALVILNQCLPRFTPLLWKHAQVRLCADGGANQVYDQMPELLPNEDPLDVRNRYKPDVIKGDMDSTRKEVHDFYSNLGTKIIDESQDQDTTDLHKCISFIQDSTPIAEKPNLCILVAGALGGRFDHEIGNINILCRFPNTRIVLLSEDSLIQLLPRSHHHEIHILSSVEGPHCGLIPIAMSSANTTTTGLQWDLKNTAMKFGGLISTSNIVQEEKITVSSDADLLWTISIRK